MRLFNYFVVAFLADRRPTSTTITNNRDVSLQQQPQVQVQQQGGPPSNFVDMSSASEESLHAYNAWANNYEKDIHQWGYDLPDKVAAVLAKHWPPTSFSRTGQGKLLDVGAGDGLSGVSLRRSGFGPSFYMIGADLSPDMLRVASKRQCYDEIKELDLNQIPFSPFEDEVYTNSFDAITCVGTMTYVDPKAGTLREFIRLVKPGGYICYTHRTDKLGQFQEEEAQLEREGLWKLIEKQGPIPYLPKNPDYGDKIQVVIYLFQKTKS